MYKPIAMASLTPITGTLGQNRAAHLLRRATYGATREEILDFANKTIETALDDLFDFPEIPPAPYDGDSGIQWQADGDIECSKYKINSWFIYHAIDPSMPPVIYHKLVFFLHTCLTVSYRHGQVHQTFWYYHLLLLMMHADQSYKTLVRKMCVDNAMGQYLDISTNTDAHPNENFARELLELFTVGKGPQIGAGNYTNYTEGDILEAARVMTGFKRNDTYLDSSYWDPDTNIPVMKPKISYHDTGNKTFSAAFQNQTIIGRTTPTDMKAEVDDLVDMIFNQDALSEFICTKLYRYYVHYEITTEIETDIIQPLAATFRQNNFEFEPVLRQLFASQHFYDEDDALVGDQVLGALIKSPFELWFGTLRFFKAYVPDQNLDLSGIQEWIHDVQLDFRDLIDGYFSPDSVAGYVPMYQAPNYNRAWISAATLPLRYKYVLEKIHISNPNDLPSFGEMDILTFVEDPSNVPIYQGDDPAGNPGPHEGARIPEHLVHHILDFVFPVPLETDRFAYFLDDLLMDNLGPLNWISEWDAYKNTGDSSGVRMQLERLFRGILQSPEYQLS